MTPEAINGLHWLVAMSLRRSRLSVDVGHGYADTDYRPPRSPYVSLVGPTGLSVEPERDPLRPDFVLLQLPGSLRGAARLSTDSLPPGQSLSLRYDGDLRVDLPSLPAGSFADDTVAAQLAAAIELQLRTAAATGQFRKDGQPMLEPARLSELAALTCRWDLPRRQLVFSSGRYGVVTQPRSSSLEFLGGTAGTALGLPTGTATPGRLHRQRREAPTAVSLDLRMDLRAGTQFELAALIDGLVRAVPTRGSLLSRPMLLARNVAQGDQSLELLEEGEPTLSSSLLHLEGADRAVDRVLGEEWTRRGSVLQNEPPRYRFAANRSLRSRCHPLPPVPDPRVSSHPAPRGYALSLAFSMAAGAKAGDRARLFALTWSVRTVLALQIDWLTADGELQADVQLTADISSPTGIRTASLIRRVKAASLQSSVFLHTRILAGKGSLELSLSGPDGEDLLETAAPRSTPVPGNPLGAHDMVATLCPSTVIAWDCWLCHLHAEPFGAADQAARRLVNPAFRLSPGDLIKVADCEDGIHPTGDAAEALVTAVTGRTVTLDRPLPRAWPKGAAILYERELFLQQVRLNRRDDLLNHLYRLTCDYRLSTFIDELVAGTSEPLAERIVVDLRSMPPEPSV